MTQFGRQAGVGVGEREGERGKGEVVVGWMEGERGLEEWEFCCEQRRVGEFG